MKNIKKPSCLGSQPALRSLSQGWGSDWSWSGSSGGRAARLRPSPQITVSGLGLRLSGLCWSWPSGDRAARLWPRPGYSKSLMSGWGVQIWALQNVKTLRFFNFINFFNFFNFSLEKSLWWKKREEQIDINRLNKFNINTGNDPCWSEYTIISNNRHDTTIFKLWWLFNNKCFDYFRDNFKLNKKKIIILWKKIF